MTAELEQALKRHTQWFGSYKASGELRKVHVWLLVNDGRIEFLTPGNSYKVRRVRRNPKVVSYVGSENGPAITGRAEVISDRGEVWRVYKNYWKTHPLKMALIGVRIAIEIVVGARVVVRTQPDEPNPLSGVTEFAA